MLSWTLSIECTYHLWRSQICYSIIIRSSVGMFRTLRKFSTPTLLSCSLMSRAEKSNSKARRTIITRKRELSRSWKTSVSSNSKGYHSANSLRIASMSLHHTTHRSTWLLRIFQCTEQRTRFSRLTAHKEESSSLSSSQWWELLQEALSKSITASM